MNTERERFEEIYEKIRVGVDNPYIYENHTMVIAWEIYQHQAAIIADLQQQLDEANRRGEELAAALKPFANFACQPLNSCETSGMTCHNCTARTLLATATSKRGG